MTKFHEPEVHDPRELEVGDQIGCVNGGRTLQVLTGDPNGTVDEFWMDLWNNPAETTHMWDEPVPHGSVALNLDGHGWKVLVLPRVWARRRIA